MNAFKSIELTGKGNLSCLSDSKSAPGMVNETLVSKDLSAIRCDCQNASFKNDAHHMTAKKVYRTADVIAGKHPRPCWHVDLAARVAEKLAAERGVVA